uniref:Uncharacterized protein n=1 Tax=viral metagenome TaxID=1070528 RepID=A0A6M3LMA0_9ZZZZ
MSLKCPYRKVTKGSVHYCGGDLYCLDTFSHLGENKVVRKATVTAQHVIRNYACANCGRRYKSIEVLNPVSYKTKEIPRSHLAKLA